MATSQQFLVNDSSTAANFKAWAKALSDFIRSCGWTNSSDTGQLNGAGAGPGGWAGVSTVPGSGLFYYEIFQPGDGLTNYYLKVEYGNASGSTNAPSIRITAAMGTNGAGTLTGQSTYSNMQTCPSNYATPSTTATYECDFSGDSGRLSVLMWRNSTSAASPQLFAVQRSLNSSGSPTGTYVTLWTDGYNGNGIPTGNMQSLHFTAGAAKLFYDQQIGGKGWPSLLMGSTGVTGSISFNGSIPVWFMQPCVGIWDYPCTAIGLASYSDLTEGVPFTVTNQYGQTRTYIPTRAGWLWAVSSTDTNPVNTNAPLTVLVEYD